MDRRVRAILLDLLECTNRPGANMTSEPTYKTRVHYDKCAWWSLISFEILTKEDLIDAVENYQAEDGLCMSEATEQQILAVIDECEIPEGICACYCDKGFISVSDMSGGGTHD